MTLSVRILLLGSRGQVGWELQRALAPLGELTALDRRGTGPWQADLSQPERLAPMLDALAPQFIVNAAAHTAVDRAESEPGLAHAINAAAPGELARWAAAHDATLVHYSSDYVFDGSGHTARSEDAPTGPLSVYGRSKLAGEEAIRASGCRHLILRTSWVYAARGGNFAKTMLRLARERERLTVIDDQWGAPTGAELIADVTAQAVAQLRQVPGKGGLYHLAAAGATTWFEYAKYVLAQAQRAQPAIEMKVTEVAPIATRDYPTPARRPHNSRLDCTRLQAAFDLRLPPWQDGVRRMLAETL